jgi:DNA-binding transcriptional regulator YdaS (Cro superfamily)
MNSGALIAWKDTLLELAALEPPALKQVAAGVPALAALERPTLEQMAAGAPALAALEALALEQVPAGVPVSRDASG